MSAISTACIVSNAAQRTFFWKQFLSYYTQNQILKDNLSLAILEAGPSSALKEWYGHETPKASHECRRQERGGARGGRFRKGVSGDLS